MTPKNPHYLLFAEASRSDRPVQTWRFVLQNVETQRRFTATDSEPTDCSERLELLAVVRGLEAIDGPAHVTLVTKSRYVSRGLKTGLDAWRSNDWCWERFGRIVPVRDHDLWRRVDRAMQYHKVNCQAWQFEEQLAADPLVEKSPLRVDSPSAIRAPKYHARRARRRTPVGRRLVSTSAAVSTSGRVDKLWTNVKTLAQTMTQPALGPTA